MEHEGPAAWPYPARKSCGHLFDKHPLLSAGSGPTHLILPAERKISRKTDPPRNPCGNALCVRANFTCFHYSFHLRFPEFRSTARNNPADGVGPVETQDPFRGHLRAILVNGDGRGPRRQLFRPPPHTSPPLLFLRSAYHTVGQKARGAVAVAVTSYNRDCGIGHGSKPCLFALLPKLLE